MKGTKTPTTPQNTPKKKASASSPAAPNSTGSKKAPLSSTSKKPANSPSANNANSRIHSPTPRSPAALSSSLPSSSSSSSLAISSPLRMSPQTPPSVFSVVPQSSSLSTTTSPKHATRVYLNPADALLLSLLPGDILAITPTENLPIRLAVLFFDKSLASATIAASPVFLRNARLRLSDSVRISKYEHLVPFVTKMTMRATTPVDNDDPDALQTYAREVMRDWRMVGVGDFVEFFWGGYVKQFRVESVATHAFFDCGSDGDVSPLSVYLVNSQSTVTVLKKQDATTRQGTKTTNASAATYKSIGGLSKQMETIKKIVEVPLLDPQRFIKY
ncbi:hypothetical protein HK100_009434, partial [Physocladia obscura]